MSTYQKSEELAEFAASVLCKFESHKPILDARLRIDYLFAFADQDENGEPIGYAIVSRGHRALGQTRKISKKDRAAGRGDAEILIDGDHWETLSEDEREAIMDHELHHIAVTSERDDMGRPVIKLRKHDYEFGWFRAIADRHGSASVEVQQARQIYEDAGQLFFPFVPIPK